MTAAQAKPLPLLVFDSTVLFGGAGPRTCSVGLVLARALISLRRKFSVGNVNAICVERPFLHAFVFTKLDFGQV